MEQYQVITREEEETLSLSEKLAKLLSKGDVLTLEGDLGAGKTTFTKGLAKGLNIARTVNSPTFNIVKEYHGDLPLFHMDVYRLENSEEDIGFDEYFNGEGITVVEWAKFISEYLPEDRLDIKIEYVNETERKLTFIPRDDRFEKVVKELIYK